MMNSTAIVLCLCGFALLGSLPFTFFRPGRLNRGWSLTAAPFFMAAVLLLAALAGLITPPGIDASLSTALMYVAVPIGAAAIGLMACTIGVHRVPISLWHQENDAPEALVTFGPYARIRHPFYASFILLLAASAAALPHAGTLVLLLAGTLQLHGTARREERRLLASSHAVQYAEYMGRTGRFLPPLLTRAAQSVSRVR